MTTAAVAFFIVGRGKESAMTTAVQVESRFATILLNRMEEANFSIKDVAEMTGITYEHMRRCVRGLVIPSKYLVKEFSKALLIDQKILSEAAASDEIMRKYGELPQALSKHDPSLEPVDRLWGFLTEEQRGDLIAQMQFLVRKNRMLHTS